MPIVGEFHGKFWRARANQPPPPGTASPTWQYPRVQRAIYFGSLFGGLQGVYDRAVWAWAIVRRLWRLTPEQTAVLERVLGALEGPHWPEAQQAVRTCATTPGFHAPEQWVEYGRALKANKGQAQNVFRHVKAVSALRTIGDGPAAISNPDAHLVVELAYQGFAAMGRPDRRVVTH